MFEVRVNVRVEPVVGEDWGGFGGGRCLVIATNSVIGSHRTQSSCW